MLVRGWGMSRREDDPVWRLNKWCWWIGQEKAYPSEGSQTARRAGEERRYI